MWHLEPAFQRRPSFHSRPAEAPRVTAYCTCSREEPATGETGSRGSGVPSPTVAAVDGPMEISVPRI